MATVAAKLSNPSISPGHISSLVLPGEQSGLLVVVKVPAMLSTTAVGAWSTRKLKRRPSYISRTRALPAQTFLVLSVVDLLFVTSVSVKSRLKIS